MNRTSCKPCRSSLVRYGSSVTSSTLEQEQSVNARRANPEARPSANRHLSLASRFQFSMHHFEPSAMIVLLSISVTALEATHSPWLTTSIPASHPGTIPSSGSGHEAIPRTCSPAADTLIRLLVRAECYKSPGQGETLDS